jgi:hypothetical protein
VPLIDPTPRRRHHPMRELPRLPLGLYEGANRYDTDNEHVLHLWRGGQSWDIRWPKVSSKETTDS